MENDIKITQKERKVGSFTLGVVLIATGIFFLCYQFIPGFNYELAFALWPIILIMLGTEVLYAQTAARKRGENVKYDAGAIVIMVISAAGSFAMGCIYYIVKNIGLFI